MSESKVRSAEVIADEIIGKIHNEDLGMGMFRIPSFDDLKKLISEAILAERTRLEEKETQLEAWMNVFGTTQLSHAIARLESAEEKSKRLSTQLAERERELDLFRDIRREIEATGHYNLMIKILDYRDSELKLQEELAQKDEEVQRLMKHDCERWHNEGYGCSICSSTHTLCRDIEKVKEMQTHCNWIVSSQAEKIREQEATIGGLRSKLERIIAKWDEATLKTDQSLREGISLEFMEAIGEGRKVLNLSPSSKAPEKVYHMKGDYCCDNWIIWTGA